MTELKMMTTYEVIFLSLCAGDDTTYDENHWGAWMTISGEYCKSRGFVEGTYYITEKGVELLDWLGGNDKAD